MASDFIGITVDGIEQVARVLKRIGDTRAMSELTDKVAKFLRGEFKKYPAPRTVSRKEAYGQTFQSDKQRRWFFAALGSGELTLPYRRTRRLGEGWQVEKFGSTDHILVNETPYAAHVMGDGEQSRMAKLIGWKTMEETIKRQADRIRQIAERFYDAWLRNVK